MLKKMAKFEMKSADL